MARPLRKPRVAEDETVDEGRGDMRRAKRSRRAAAAAGLDRVIHERVRLGTLSALAVNDSLGFTELRALLETTDGNLSVHARKLEEAGYIDCEKGFEGRVPRTEYRITRAGRKALSDYLSHMEALIEAVKETG